MFKDSVAQLFTCTVNNYIHCTSLYDFSHSHKLIIYFFIIRGHSRKFIYDIHRLPI
jgi:hypothetical protein